MKRFEYKYIFQSRPDFFLEKHIIGYKSEIDELPVTIWLDSYVEAKKRFPFQMEQFYDFLRMERSGKKFRSIDLTLRIKWYALIKKIKRRYK